MNSIKEKLRLLGSNYPTNSCRADHVALPDDWMSHEYDDSGWLPATTYTADEVTNAAGFRNDESTLFAGAQFVWTGNLNLDNHVVCRLTVQSAQSGQSDEWIGRLSLGETF